MQSTFDRISRLIARLDIKAVQISTEQNAYLLSPVKFVPGCRVPGIYCSSCECSKVYIEQAGCATEAVYGEHVACMSMSRQLSRQYGGQHRGRPLNKLQRHNFIGKSNHSVK
jgi:hypothetical protein